MKNLKMERLREIGREKRKEMFHCCCLGCGYHFGTIGKDCRLYVDCPECGSANSFITSGENKLTTFFERGIRTA